MQPLTETEAMAPTFGLTSPSVSGLGRDLGISKDWSDYPA